MVICKYNIRKGRIFMKKFISCILMVAIFLSLFTMVTFAESDPPNLVADYRFNVDTQGWYVFNGTSGLTHQDGYISASNEGKSWVSRRLVETDEKGFYCYFAAFETDDSSILLHYYDKPYLLSSRMKKIPLKWLFGETEH